MTIEIKQSTTTYPLVFMMVDSTDHVTGKTGLTPTVTISKAGAAFASPAGAVSEIGSGWYKVAGNATDSATLGPLILHATGTGADPVDVVYNVSARLVDDLATPTNITAGTITTVTNLTNLPTMPTGWVTATGIAASALNGKGDWNIGKTGYTLTQAFPANFSSFSITAGGLVTLAGVTHTGAVIPTVSTLTGHTPQTGDSYARIGATGSGLTTLATQALLTTVAGYVDTEVAAIKAKTDNLPASPAAVGDIPTASAIADQVWDETISGHAGVGSTGAALSAAGGSGDPWSTALPGAYGVGTAGKIVGDYIDAAISSISAGSGLDAAGVRAAVGLATANLDTQLGNIVTDTAEIGTAGAGLTALASAANLATLTGYVDTEVAAIKAKTDNLPASPAAVGSAMTLSTAGYEAAADAILNRNVSGGSNTGRVVKQAFHFIRNKWVVAGGTLTVYDTDDTTSSWTSAVTGTAGADPITSTDPT